MDIVARQNNSTQLRVSGDNIIIGGLQMDVSKIGNNNAFSIGNFSIDKSIPVHIKGTGLNKRVFDREEIADGQLVDSKALDTYKQYLTEYENGLTNGQSLASRGGLDGLSLEGFYRYALEQFEKIENGSDDDETKDIKRLALEMALKSITDKFSFAATWSDYKIDASNVEKDKKVMADMKIFQHNQFTAINNSMRKLTLKFLDYVKNADSYNYNDMITFLNESTQNNRNIYNLELKEITEYLDYVKNSGYMHTQSNADADFYRGFFKTVADGSVDSVTQNRWGNTIFNTLIHQKFASMNILV